MEEDDANVIDFNAQRAAASLRAAPEADPKKAMRAYKLSEATGLPAGMVLDDMEATENDYRAALGTSMVRSNENLAKFLNSYPLAATISKNDLGNLDQTSEKLTAWQNDQVKSTWGEKARGLALVMNMGIESGTGIAASAIGYMTGATGFQGADKRMLKSTEEGLKKQMGEEEYKRVRGSVEGTLAGDVAFGAGGLVPMLAAGFFGGTLPAALTMGLLNAEELRRRAEEKGGDQLAAFTAGGAIGTAFGFVPAHLLTKGVQAQAPGFISWTSAKLTQSGVFGVAMALTGEAQHDFNEWAARLLFDPNAMYHPDSRRFLTGFILGGMLGAGFQKVKPYVDADVPIPPGIDPIIDQTKGMEAKYDLEKLKELEKEVGKDETRELDPDFYSEKFLSQHGNATLRIDIEAIRALYGNKIPATDDGILGHIIPDLDVAIRVARETGGHVEVKLNDWLAKVDPEVANALHDDLILREGGVSVNGDKANKEYQQKIEERVEKAAEEQKAVEAQKPITTFQTAKGSTYEVHPDGTTTRTKAARTDVGHEGDEGLKPRSEKTYYVSAEDANRLAPPSGGGWRIIDHGDGTLSVATKNQEGKWGISPESRNVKVTTTPSTGSIPIELWRQEIIYGKPAYKEMHPGNKIVETREIVSDATEDAVRPGQQEARLRAPPRPRVEPTERLPGEGADDVSLAQRPEAPKEVKLQRVRDYTDPKTGETATYFNIVDEKGLNAGFASIAYKDGVIFIEGIGASTRFGKTAEDRYWAFGSDLVRSVFEQLKSAYPDATKIAGNRVEGARKKAGTTGYVERDLFELNPENVMKAIEDGLKGIEDAIKPDLKSMLPTGEDIFHYEISDGTWVALKPTNTYSKVEMDMVKFIDEAIEKFIGRDKEGKPRITAIETQGIVSERLGGDIQGLYRYDPYSTAVPLLLYSLRTKDPYGTLRHEVIHHLYRKGFFTETEWKIMEDAAEANGWIKKHNIDKRYADFDYKIQLEEAIADEFRIWGRERYANHPAVKPFEKLRALMAQIRAKLVELTGLKEVTADDLFARIESGEIKLREPQDPASDFMRRVNAVREEAGLREETLFSKDGSPFEPKALGITVKENRKILRLWNRQVKADEKANQEAEMKKVMRQRSPQWKAWRKEMREEVEDEVKNRPVNLVDEFMRETKFKFDVEFLSEAQKEFLPKELYGKNTGIEPDKVATMFGYHSGEAMLHRLGLLVNKRKNTDPRTFLKNEVDMITDQRMEKKYGTPEKEAMQEAYDHALGENTLDLIHEQTIALGSTKPDVAIQITKKQVKDYVMDMFDRLPMSMARASDFLAQAKRAEQRIRMALMDDNLSEAYREHQAKEYAVISAKYANDLKSVENKVNRIARRFGKREVENADPEIVAFIQQTLDRFEFPLNRKAYDYEDRIAMFQESGAPKYRDLRELVQKKWEGDPDPPISDLLYDPNFKGPIEKLTTEQYKELVGSLGALAKKASEAYTVEVNGEKVRIYDIVSEMGKIFANTFKGEEYRVDLKPGHLTKLVKEFWANHIVMETIFNRMDKNNYDGLFNQALGLPLIRGANAAARLMLDAGKRFKAMPIATEMNKLVENPWFRRPDGVDADNKIIYGSFLQLTKGNVLAILQNMGNPQNWYGLLDGYGIPRDKSGDVMDWVWRHVDETDVKRAKMMGDTFDWAFDKAAATVAADTGYPPPKVKTWVVKTPWGDFDGWYHKIAYDKDMAQSIKSLVDPSMLIERQFNRAKPSANYAKTRTGATGPYMLDLDLAPYWVNEMLYDSAVRLPLKEASKIMGHTNFKLAMSKHMGPHYTALIDPFLRDVAGVMKDYDASHSLSIKTWRFIRANLISHYVGLNPGTWVKHNFSAAMNSMTENGKAEFWIEMANVLFRRKAETGDRWGQFAMQRSDQLAPRHVNILDTMSGAHAQVYGTMRLGVSAKDYAASFKDRPLGEGIRFAGKQLGGQLLSYRNMLMWVEAAPLATFDLLTAKSTWLVAYKQEMARSGDANRAIDMGDRAVRRSHGATTVTNRPGHMRGSEFARSMTAFYTTFNHFLQRQYEFAWAIKELSGRGKYHVNPDEILEWKGTGAGAAFKLGAAAVPVFAAQFVSYALWPAFVEMLAGGFEKDQREGWVVNYLKHLARFGFGGFVYARDIASALLHGADPTVGLGGEVYKTSDKFIKRIINSRWKTREQQQAFFKETYAFFNMMNGMLPANAVLRSGMFAWNWVHNRERVHTPGDIWWGMTKGTTQPHRRH